MLDLAEPPLNGPPAARAGHRAGRLHALTASFLSLFAVVGLALYGLPFFYDFMVRDHGWARAQVTSGNAISKLLVGPLFGFIAGWIVDRFGPRGLMSAGIVMAGLALVGLGLTSSLAVFYVCYVVNALGYVCGGPLPSQVLLSRWFAADRGKAMGVAYLGIGLGGVIVPLLSVWLLTRLGWQHALVTLGAIIIIVALPPALMLRNPPEEAQAHATRRESAPIGDIVRAPRFWLLMIGSMCSIGAVGGMIQNLKLFLSLDLAYTQSQAATIASIVLASSLVGRVLMGWLADRWATKHVMLLIYGIVGAAIPVLFVAGVPGAIYVFAVLFGIGLGGDYMIVPLMAAELFGVRVLGRVMGIVLTADGIAEASAPWAVARLRDTSGSYTGGFAILIGLAAIGAAAVLFLPRGDRATK